MIALIAALAAGASGAALQAPLQPWSHWVGHCWVGPAPQGRGEDKHCFDSVYGGKHVRDRHTVTVGGQEVYAGESLYSVQGPKVIFTYWNSLGGVGTGEAAFAGEEWSFSGAMHATPAATEQPFAVRWRKVEGGYEVRGKGESAARLFKRAD